VLSRVSFHALFAQCIKSAPGILDGRELRLAQLLFLETERSGLHISGLRFACILSRDGEILKGRWQRWSEMDRFKVDG
jgi:hypothetical protein